MKVIITMSWCIRMERNALIFYGEQHSVQSVTQRLKYEFALVILRAKPISQTQCLNDRRNHVIEFILFVTFFVS
jgi:hypothetical protein